MAEVLDIDLLRTFQAIVRFGQFLAAASFLNKSPSAVSLHVRRLEALAGGRLLERDNQTVNLTPLGRRVALQSAELLRHHDQLLASFSTPLASGRVRLGISEEYAGVVLGCSLPHLSADFPHIELEVETASSGRLSALGARSTGSGVAGDRSRCRSIDALRENTRLYSTGVGRRAQLHA